MKADLPCFGLLADYAGNAFNLPEENSKASVRFVLEDMTETRDAADCGDAGRRAESICVPSPSGPEPPCGTILLPRADAGEASGIAKLKDFK